MLIKVIIILKTDLELTGRWVGVVWEEWDGGNGGRHISLQNRMQFLRIKRIKQAKIFILLSIEASQPTKQLNKKSKPHSYMPGHLPEWHSFKVSTVESVHKKMKPL